MVARRRPRVLLAAVPTVTLTGACLLAAPPPAAARGGWDWPVPPTSGVGRPFDAPAHRWAPGHRGVDLPAPAGTAVRAAGAGTVVFAGLVAGRPLVSVSHVSPQGELRTTYEPVIPGVRVGARVTTGDVLGRLAAPGSHCTPLPCLHWGVRRGDEYLDPLALVGSGPPRLLPLWTTTAPPVGPTIAGAPPAPDGLATRLAAAVAATSSWLRRQLGQG